MTPQERPDPEVIYANVVGMTAGPFDLVLDFGFKSPEQAQRRSTEYQIVARVAMSHAQAKSMIPLLARIIADFEKEHGIIPTPGFEEGSK